MKFQREAIFCLIYAKQSNIFKIVVQGVLGGIVVQGVLGGIVVHGVLGGIFGSRSTA